MAKWIALSLFQELYSSTSDLLDAQVHQDFLNRLQSDEGARVREKAGISAQDFELFLKSIQRKEAIVFHGWVAQSKVLQETLNRGHIASSFRDENSVLNHTLTPDFQVFITPFLAPILLRKIPTEMTPLSAYFSYVILLDEDTRPTVERKLFESVRAHLESLRTAQELDKEQALIDLVKPLCSKEFIESMNTLSKGSYALKMEYIDSILEAIRTPACTVRFANWILKQMLQLNLNIEHQLKLQDLREELASGALRVKKLETASPGVQWKPILIITFIALILCFGGYLMVAKPFSKAEIHHAYDSMNSAFTSEELRAIDSIAAEIDQESYLEGRQIDPTIIIESGDMISLRKPFNVALMEQIFTDVNQDIVLQENYYIDSCGTEVDFQRYPGVKDLSKRKAKKAIQFRNDSEYEVIVYVTNNTASGSVYSMLVQPESTVEFKMNEKDLLTTVAGNHWIPFVPPVGSFQDEKPSKDFRFHFCKTDDNYFESINTTLCLGSTSRDRIKYMVVGKRGVDYQLIDVYGVSQAY